jgi:hypothetical protein
MTRQEATTAIPAKTRREAVKLESLEGSVRDFMSS